MSTISKDFIESNSKKVANGCWLWLGTCDPYARYGGKRNRLAIHRESYILHKGPVPEGSFVCHHCDTPACINPEHLFIGTNSDNIRDCVRKGRHNTTKLNAKKVEAIRKLFAKDYSRAAIARLFDVTHQNVCSIVNMETWL
jgi:hypothetical protein